MRGFPEILQTDLNAISWENLIDESIFPLVIILLNVNKSMWYFPFFHDFYEQIQGCDLRKLERSPVLLTLEIKGSQRMFSK